MKSKNYFLLLTLISLLTISSVFAQHGAVGGGLMTESDMQTYLNRLDDFLLTPEGLDIFPEVRIHDQLSSETVHQIFQSTRPATQTSSPLDQFGKPRTCVSYHDASSRYFICNQKEFDNTIDNEPRIYKLLLHEIFVQAGIETPINETVTSDYHVSDRIVDHLFRDDAWGWLPGSLPKKSVISSGIWCTDQPFASTSEVGPQMTASFLFWEASGLVRLIRLKKGMRRQLSFAWSPLPQNLVEASAPFDQQGIGYKFAPLHLIQHQTQLWLATNENLILRSSTMALQNGGTLWSQIPALIYLKNERSTLHFLVSCQSMLSWKESVFYPYFNLTNPSPSTPEKE